jgi:hypothetical protein
MKLLRDEWRQVYVWVDDLDENIELSPHFDYEEDADNWYLRMKKETSNEKNIL